MRTHNHPIDRMSRLLLCAMLIVASPASGQSFSSNLPIVMLSKSEPWQLIDSAWDGFEIVVNMGIIDNGPGQRNSITDPLNHYNGKIRIKVQGSSSVGLPKRSFRITTLNQYGKGADMALLGMPAHEDWILKSLYQDKSLLRDDLAFHIFNQMGHYSSRCRFIELFVDGDYRGVYQLLEKVKRDKHRVDVARLKPNENKGDDVTGGYIISLDKYRPGIDKGWYSRYKSNATQDSANFFLYYYPKADSITPKQQAYIRNYIDQFERALASSDFTNPTTGYRKYIDVQSFIDNFLVNELSRNVDGYRASTFFHKDKESSSRSKLQAGPIWDFNIAFGNASYNGGSDPYWWAYDQYAYTNYTPWWWRRLLSDSLFRKDLRCRYRDLRNNVLSETALYEYIDSRVNELREAQARNFQRYPILGKVVHPNPAPVPHTWDSEIAYLKWWLHERLNWMDMMISGTCSSPVQHGSSPVRMVGQQNPLELPVIMEGRGTDVRVELIDLVGNRTVEVYEGPLPGYSRLGGQENLKEGHYAMKTTINGNTQYKKLLKVYNN